jgi:PadR family transcriptional regulator PadR
VSRPETYVVYDCVELSAVRRTHALVQVAVVLLADPRARHWGYSLSKESGVRSGVMYPALARLLEAGWLTDGWEDEAATGGKRPPRRYYELTETGLRELGGVVRAARTDPRFRGVVPGWAM